MFNIFKKVNNIEKRLLGGIKLDFLTMQLIIVITILIGGILAGKKGSIISSGVWLIATLLVIKDSWINIFQLISVILAYQISMIIGIARDYFKNRKLKEKS